MSSILGLRTFTLEIGGTPTLTYEARNLREANEICCEEWLLDDLARLTSNAVALWDRHARLRVRYATQGEAACYLERSVLVKIPADELILVYLRELDGSGKTNAPVGSDAPTPSQN